MEKTDAAKEAFLNRIPELEKARKAWMTGTLQGSWAREAAIANSLRELANCFEIKLQEPLRIDSRGEFSIVAMPENGGDIRMGCSKFGEGFAAILSQCETRTGIDANRSKVLPENGWTRINHFEAEKMIRGFAAQLKNEMADAPVSQAQVGQRPRA